MHVSEADLAVLRGIATGRYTRDQLERELLHYVLFTINLRHEIGQQNEAKTPREVALPPLGPMEDW